MNVMELTLDDVKRGAKREDFRAGVQMRMLMPRLSVHVTRWVLTHTELRPNQITLVSFAVGLAACAAFAATTPAIVALGLLAFHLHVLLDYVDGEVARCRKQTSVAGAYFDLITDRITFPLFVFCSALGAYRAAGDPGILILGYAASFGLVLDKFAVDAWYRANSGASEAEVEDRYVEAPERSTARLWMGRVRLLAVMSRGLTAFLTYMLLATLADASGLGPLPLAGSARVLVLWAFALLMPAGAIARFIYVYRRGSIPRRQQLL
jgi:phosphatidylglycerophosphate synthase